MSKKELPMTYVPVYSSKRSLLRNKVKLEAIKKIKNKNIVFLLPASSAYVERKNAIRKKKDGKGKKGGKKNLRKKNIVGRRKIKKLWKKYIVGSMLAPLFAHLKDRLSGGIPAASALSTSHPLLQSKFRPRLLQSRCSERAGCTVQQVQETKKN